MSRAIFFPALAAGFLALAMAGCGRLPENAPPLWAYPVNPKIPPAPVSLDAPLHIAGSNAAFTPTQIGNLFAVPDWRPEEHPAMPSIVSGGRKPDVMACGYCHLPTANGRPENAALAGLSKAYIIAQMRHFRDGSRASTVSGRAPTALMVKIAKAASDAEIEAAATYFSALPRRSYVHVVEAEIITKVDIAGWVYRSASSGGHVQLGQRIVEMPDDFELFEKRDPDVRYTAFVPTSSIKRGEEIARNWGAQGTFACSTCHGAHLQGMANAPALAGRSPTYVVRQLYDFQSNARGGDAASPMLSVVKSMRTADMIAVAAYLGSIRP